MESVRRNRVGWWDAKSDAASLASASCELPDSRRSTDYHAGFAAESADSRRNHGDADELAESGSMDEFRSIIIQRSGFIITRGTFEHDDGAIIDEIGADILKIGKNVIFYGYGKCGWLHADHAASGVWQRSTSLRT